MVETDSILEEVLSHGPSADSLSILLTRMKKEGRLSEVVQECIKFLRVYPDSIRLRLLLAESCLEIGFIGLAESELVKVTSMIEDLVPSYKLLAGIYARQRRVKEAADTLRLYLAHRPDAPDALELLEEVEPADEAVVAGDEEDIVPALATPTIAELYYSQGRLNAAIGTYEKVLNDKPDDTESLKRLTELRELAADRLNKEKKEKDDPAAGTEKMITVLEKWLPKIKEIQHE